MRPTEKYRALLEKQKQEFYNSFNKLFTSVEMILDNVDQVVIEKKRKAKQDVKSEQIER
jgi:hypothetical protein